ncbi:MAG: hypothetical protein ABTD50_23920 [Polyangiaceae bacterium]|jgi:hypothetical protein
MKLRTYEQLALVWIAAMASACASHDPHSAGSGAAQSSSGGDNSSGDDGTDDGGSGDDGGTMSRTATLDDVSLANVDRHGDTLVLSLDGTDTAGLTTEALVQFVDGAGHPITVFDTNWDGVADSSQKRFHFDSSTFGQTSFSATITMPNMYSVVAAAEYPDAGADDGGINVTLAAIVALSDVNGDVTSQLTAPLAPQPVSEVGGPCDPANVTSRCDEGLTCNSTSVCAAGVAPTVTQVAYYSGDAPAQLFLVNDPDEDLSTVTVNYLDGTGNSLAVDLSADDAGAPSSGITLSAQTSNGRAFFVGNYPTAILPTLVPQISVVPTDSDGRKGPAVTAMVTAPMYKASGADCDPYGFVLCSDGTQCFPGTVGASSTCTATTQLLSAACANAPPISMDGILGAWGVASGPSLFDPPAGCSIPSAISRPESVLSLTLPDDVNTLTLSTATPETTFDTVLYVLPSCNPLPPYLTDVGMTDAGTGDGGAVGALGCNDDGPGQGYASTLTLNNVSAGTYTVIVDSVSGPGGSFGLTISVQ